MIFCSKRPTLRAHSQELIATPPIEFGAPLYPILGRISPKQTDLLSGGTGGKTNGQFELALLELCAIGGGEI